MAIHGVTGDGAAGQVVPEIAEAVERREDRELRRVVHERLSFVEGAGAVAVVCDVSPHRRVRL